LAEQGIARDYEHRSPWGPDAARDLLHSGMDDETKKKSKRVYIGE
jgi:hypothetical protein